MERYEQTKGTRIQIFFNNFIGGIAWALGVTIGLALIVTILAFILKNVNLIPIVGDFVAKVIQFVIEKSPNLLTR
jgi:hypothetical protein